MKDLNGIFRVSSWIPSRTRCPREGILETVRNKSYFRPIAILLTAFAQHKRDEYSLQTKGKKPTDEKIFERHVKLQADPRRIRGGARDIRISIG